MYFAYSVSVLVKYSVSPKEQGGKCNCCVKLNVPITVLSLASDATFYNFVSCKTFGRMIILDFIIVHFTVYCKESETNG